MSAMSAAANVDAEEQRVAQSLSVRKHVKQLSF